MLIHFDVVSVVLVESKAKLVTAKKGVAKAAERMRLMKDEEYVISSIGVPDSVDTTDGRWIMMPFMNSGSFSALFRACRDSDACMCQTKEHPSPCWETIREHDLLWVLALFYQAVEGVSAIHAKGYVHMDLKLDNIMLQCKGTSCFASIIDLDQMCGPGEGDCEGGTVGFAAPEVHEGHQGLPANDVWSMGTVLYILLYGEWPPYMEFFWNPDSARKQAAYKPEEDATIPKKRRSIDNLVVEMLNTNYETRISLEEVKKGVKDFITAEQPDQEVLDMLYKTPTARGLTDDLPTCISDYTPSSFDPKHCRNTPTRAEGWFTCGICVLCDPCCECWTLYNGRIKTEYFFAKSCE